MSARLVEYVKWRVDAAWHIKSFMLLIADFYSEERLYAFPGIKSLARIMDRDAGQVRELIRDERFKAVFRYEEGRGRTHLSRFYLAKEVSELLFSSPKGEKKEKEKEEVFGDAIRNELANSEPIPSTRFASDAWEKESAKISWIVNSIASAPRASHLP